MTIKSDQASAEELGKFFSLHSSLNRPIEMWSGRVDRYWHELLEGPAYDEFCTLTCGRKVEHEQSAGYGKVSWIAAYEDRFGKLPRVWFYTSDGIFDQKAYDDYLRTGCVVASWDCGPVMPDKKKQEPSEHKPKKESEKPANAPGDENNKPKEK